MRVPTIALATAAVALLAISTGTARSSGSSLAGTRWVVTDLGNLGRARVTVADINDHGQVVGTTVTRHGAWRGFVWQNGSMAALGRGPFAGAQAINERGQIIGTSSSAAVARRHAVLWEKGRMIDLLPRGRVTAVNDHGQIIGSRFVPTANGLYSTPVIWEHGKVRDLLPGGAASALNNRGQVAGTTASSPGRATVWQNGKVTDLGPGVPIDINERGKVVGYSNPVGVEHAVLWQNGKVTELGLGVEPVAINERGQVIGLRAGPGCEWRCVHAVLWQKGIRTDLGTLGGKWAIPTAISDRGQVVGYMGYGVDSTRSGEQHAFVWQDGVMTRLPSPFPGARTRAIAINDRNQIIGDNCLADCGSREPSARSKFAVIWTLK